MNKIIIDEYDITLKDIEGILEIHNPKTHIHLMGTNKITELILPDYNETIIDLEENTVLNLESYWDEFKEEQKIIMNATNKTTVNCRFNIKVREKFKLKLQTNLQGDSNQSNICIHVTTTENGICDIEANGYIMKKTKENVLIEELKGLTTNPSTITFLPNLIVDADDVKASHNATIKCFDEEELFYLKSKGLAEEEAKDLIQKGFLNKQKLGGEKNES